MLQAAVLLDEAVLCGARFGLGDLMPEDLEAVPGLGRLGTDAQDLGEHRAAPERIGLLLEVADDRSGQNLHPALVGGLLTRDHLEQGGLPSPVGPDDRHPVPGRDEELGT